VTFIVDGGPNLMLVLVDGVLCDGGENAQRGWGRVSRRLTDVSCERATLRIAPQLQGSVERLRLYQRPLRVCEAAAIEPDRPADVGGSKEYLE
jgi:hypothetical protein